MMTRSTGRGKQQRHRIDLRTLILGAMIGASLEYLGDPDKGRRRRAVTWDQLRATARHGLRHLSSEARYIKGFARGAVKESVLLYEPDNPDPDDSTLRDRVESELFRHHSIPKGHLNINVARGIVELRGQVEHPSEIDAIEEKVQNIEGVHTIHNYLHVPNMPAPNKARVLSIS
ncbi:MAG TPA: BON domain-containing protein [Chloroflexota bacterium]